jgi:hypothetical protein
VHPALGLADLVTALQRSNVQAGADFSDRVLAFLNAQ